MLINKIYLCMCKIAIFIKLKWEFILSKVRSLICEPEYKLGLHETNGTESNA